MEALIEKPTRQDQKLAFDSLMGFKRAIAERESADVIKILIQESGESISLPRKALELLSFILSNMAEGKAISLIPSEAEVTTQQAADMLNVSRPHVVKLLEQGAIPFKKVGSHRRVLLEDLLKYEAELEERRSRNLQFLAQQAQELNLGYE
ncbi:helix-turn-helix domain-containing protein [Rufibacter sediminis]|uniref:Helix-turn-helix domain-containing protein n=1 Tax=Rufibacter sediminis TaxID=2762756 RepID=A0ABR6VQ55_9BACT|nr:helix-turn-helix domain-containing protein [Rufibacter sediminis]MBC3538988.1 helix-turn-helix domain-containing protein [Rufibacter sediminis]